MSYKKIDRRTFFKWTAAGSVLPVVWPSAAFAQSEENAGFGTNQPLLGSPPVVQHLSENGFSVSLRVNRLCTGVVEWGTDPDHLSHRAVATWGGLVQWGERALQIPVEFPGSLLSGSSVYYRFGAQELFYPNRFPDLQRGITEWTDVRALRIPDPARPSLRVVVVNDTHEQDATVEAFAGQVRGLSPDLLVWNGDTTTDFHSHKNPAEILLGPGREPGSLHAGGWAAERPLLFVPGNHEMRGIRAGEVLSTLTPGPAPGLPYNAAYRDGPLALISMNTGEDRPDSSVEGMKGLGAFDPHREKQAGWLAEAVDRPEIRSAPFKILLCHIPLRLGDQKSQPSEHAASLWMPTLKKAGFDLLVSGHYHSWRRFDDPTAAEPVMQVVGGGPVLDQATVIILDASPNELSVRLQNLYGELLDQRTLRTRA
jgi:predicted phosphodiesterase